MVGEYNNVHSAFEGAGVKAHDRVIIHIDIDCFYAQVEMIRHPELKDKPLGIQQKYIIVTCNYPARNRGLNKLMLVKEAKEKCPDLVLVNGEDLTNYRNMSYKISNYLQKYCPLVERLGFDENFLDVTQLVTDRLQLQSDQEMVAGHIYNSDSKTVPCSCGCYRRLVTGSHVAAEIRNGLYEELGITCCAGISYNKLLSKLVAGTHKPNQQTTLFPDQVDELLGRLSNARNIPGIGHSSGKRLRELGIVSVVDLQRADTAVLEEEFGTAAMETMKKLSAGIDDSPVVAFGLPQTLSDEDSFRKCSSMKEAETKVRQLINSLLKRLLEDGRTPHTLRVTIRRFTEIRKYHRESRQCNIPASVFHDFAKEKTQHASDQLHSLAIGLFAKMVDVKQPFHLTLINIAFAKMETKSANNITSFFSPKSKKRKAFGDWNENHSELSLPVETSKSCDSMDQMGHTNKNLFKCNMTPEQGDTVGGHGFDGECSQKPGQNTCVPNLGTKIKDLNRSPSGKGLSFFAKRRSTDLKQWFSQSSSTNTELKEIRENQSVKTRKKILLSTQELFEPEVKSQKKIAVCSRSNQDQGEMTLDKALPEDVDKSVFKELPQYIQDEILGTAPPSHPKSVQMNDESSSFKSVNHWAVNDASATRLQNSLQSNVSSVSKSTALLLDGKMPVHDLTGEHKTKCKIPGERRTECEIPGEQRNECEIPEIPLNIDKSVFVNLPPDIQQELMLEWKQKSVSNRPVECSAERTTRTSKVNHQPKTASLSSFNNSTKGQKEEHAVASKPFFKMPKPSSKNNILSYFSKQ